MSLPPRSLWLRRSAGGEPGGARGVRPAGPRGLRRRRPAKRPSPAASPPPTPEPVVGHLIRSVPVPATVTSVIDSFAALQWGRVAERLREIQASLREDSDADISIKSLVTLRQTLRRVARVPDPRIGSGESGILEAVWAFGDEGMLVLDCREDGRLGCVVLRSADGRAFSETFDVEAACTLLDCLFGSGLLGRY